MTMLALACLQVQSLASYVAIPPRDGHPSCSAINFPCRCVEDFHFPSECALPGAPKLGVRTIARILEISSLVSEVHLIDVNRVCVFVFVAIDLIVYGDAVPVAVGRFVIAIDCTNLAVERNRTE
jgi:hypothetical protein